jgi:hypothetical protein
MESYTEQISTLFIDMLLRKYPIVNHDLLIKLVTQRWSSTLYGTEALQICRNRSNFFNFDHDKIFEPILFARDAELNDFVFIRYLMTSGILTDSEVTYMKQLSETIIDEHHARYVSAGSGETPIEDDEEDTQDKIYTGMKIRSLEFLHQHFRYYYCKMILCLIGMMMYDIDTFTRLENSSTLSSDDDHIVTRIVERASSETTSIEKSVLTAISGCIEYCPPSLDDSGLPYIYGSGSLGYCTEISRKIRNKYCSYVRTLRYVKEIKIPKQKEGCRREKPKDIIKSKFKRLLWVDKYVDIPSEITPESKCSASINVKGNLIGGNRPIDMFFCIPEPGGWFSTDYGVFKEEFLPRSKNCSVNKYHPIHFSIFTLHHFFVEKNVLTVESNKDGHQLIAIGDVDDDVEPIAIEI